MTNPPVIKVPDTPVVWKVIGHHLYQAFFDGHLHLVRIRGRRLQAEMVSVDRNKMTIWMRWIKYHRRLYIMFFHILSPFVKPSRLKISPGAARNK
jgi:hypothetical protein